METLPLHTLAFALIWKTIATGAIIIIAGRVAQGAGPILTSLLVSIPVNAGPGFFFISLEAGEAFVSRGALTLFAASGAVFAYSTAYALVAGLGRFWVSLGFGLLAWSAAAWITLFLEDSLLGAMIAVIGGVAIAVLFYRRVESKSERGNGVAGWKFLIVRGLVAGLVVAGVATASPWLGATYSGLLLAFPTTLACTAWMLQGHYGNNFAAATMQGSQRGLASYMTFGFSLYYLSGPLLAWQAVCVSFMLAMVVGASLAAVSWRRRGVS